MKKSDLDCFGEGMCPKCPFKDPRSSVIKEMQTTIDGLTEVMNDHEKLLDSIRHIPEKVDELRGVMQQAINDLRYSIERLGLALIKAFVFIGMSVLAVVIVLGLIIVSWGQISVDAGTVQIRHHPLQLPGREGQ